MTEGAWQALSSGRGWSCQHRLTESLSPAPGSSQPIRGRHSSRCCTIPSQSGAEAARKGWRYNKNGLTQTLTPINALMRSIDREPPPAWLMMEHERDKSPVVLLLGLRPGGRGSVGSVSGGLSFPPSFSHPSVSPPPLQCAAVCCTELQWGRMVAWAQHSLLPPPFLCLSPGVLCQVQICKNIQFYDLNYITLGCTPSLLHTSNRWQWAASKDSGPLENWTSLTKMTSITTSVMVERTLMKLNTTLSMTPPLYSEQRRSLIEMIQFYSALTFSIPPF